MAASTTALPPLTCTARGRRNLAAVVVCCKAGQLWAVCLRPEPSGESTGCVRLQCLVQQAFCLPAIFACHPHCPSQVLAPFILLCPRPFHFASVASASFAPVSCPCAPGSSVRASSLLLGPAVCQLQDCPVGSCNTGLQWRPVHRSIFDLPFFLQSP